jgi:hypothetical protein
MLVYENIIFLEVIQNHCKDGKRLESFSYSTMGYTLTKRLAAVISEPTIYFEHMVRCFKKTLQFYKDSLVKLPVYKECHLYSNFVETKNSDKTVCRDQTINCNECIEHKNKLLINCKSGNSIDNGDNPKSFVAHGTKTFDDNRSTSLRLTYRKENTSFFGIPNQVIAIELLMLKIIFLKVAIAV